MGTPVNDLSIKYKWDSRVAKHLVRVGVKWDTLCAQNHNLSTAKVKQ